MSQYCWKWRTAGSPKLLGPEVCLQCLFVPIRWVAKPISIQNIADWTSKLFCLSGSGPDSEYPLGPNPLHPTASEANKTHRPGPYGAV